MGAFDMDVERVNPEVSVPKKSRIASLTIAGKWMNVLMQKAMMAMLVNATLPGGEVCRHFSGELPDPLLVQEGREKECETLRQFGVYERVPSTKQWGSEFESSGWMTTSATWTDRSL